MLNYDLFADGYLRIVASGGPRSAYKYMVQRLAEQGEIQGRAICDIGCGPGELADQLQLLGGKVTGLDLSASLLAHARSLNPDVAWIQDDAMTMGKLQDDEAFDVAVSCLMLMDVPDHRAVFRQARRLLKPDGLMIWLLMHPCFQSPYSHPLEDGSRQVYQYAPRYWKSKGKGTLRSTLGAYHRPVAAYLNDFMGAGFELLSVEEPDADKAHATVIPFFGAIGRKRGDDTSSCGVEGD